MKAQGFRARLIWDKLLEPGQVRLAAPVIWKSSVDIARSNQGVGEILEGL